ncbi:hypothetical protein PCE1_003269 [Barthelona sp. PCE]
MSRTVIIDNGSGYIKCGFPSDRFPHSTFPNVVGRPIARSGANLKGLEEVPDLLLGDQVEPYLSALQLTRPIDHGIITHLDDQKLIWDYAFNKKLVVDPSETKVLLTEAPLNPVRNRENMLEVLFENFDVPAAQVYAQAVLTLYASGQETGCVVDSGDGVTHVVPISNGMIFHHQVKRLNVAGRDITRNLLKLMCDRGFYLNEGSDLELVRKIKEEACYIAYDLDYEKKLNRETTAISEDYRLPDGSFLNLSHERFLAAECLFQPHLVGLNELPGVDMMTFNAINECPITARKGLYENIFVSGGTSMYPGFPTRLERSIKSIYKRIVRKGGNEGRVKIKVKAPANRKNSVFIGGAILAQVAEASADFWIQKSEYEECGANFVAKNRCGQLAF